MDQPADILRYTLPVAVTAPKAKGSPESAVHTDVKPGAVGITPVGSRSDTIGTSPIGSDPIGVMAPLGFVPGNSSEANNGDSSVKISSNRNDNAGVGGSEVAGLLTEAKVRCIMGKRVDFSREAVSKVRIVIK